MVICVFVCCGCGWVAYLVVFLLACAFLDGGFAVCCFWIGVVDCGLFSGFPFLWVGAIHFLLPSGWGVFLCCDGL